MTRVGPIPEGLVERVGLAFNLGPGPVAEAMFAPVQARALQIAAATGVMRRLPATTAELAAAQGWREEGTRLLCETLAAAGHLQARSGAWELTDRARPWLDPESDTSVLAFIENTGRYWDWWGRLEDILRTGDAVEIHSGELDTPEWWRSYIEGQFELARLSAPEVARAIRLPRQARSLLDVAGGHGWFSAALCARHGELTATVLDLPGSAAVGREIIEREGYADRVRFTEGDLRTAELGGPYDGALAFNIVHHLSEDENVALLHRLRDALTPGAPLAILDLFAREEPDSGSMLGLFFWVTSGAATYTPEQLAAWLAEAGFERPRRVAIRRIPSQTLFVATRR